MSSSLIHRCQHCGYETEVSSSLSAFAENPHCRQCGLSAREGDTKMQEDLSALFSRNMMVGNHPEYRKTEPSSEWKMAAPFSAPPANPITYSITQHYHHSGHQAPTAPNLDALRKLHPVHISPEETLIENGINPASLSLSQLTLVQQADPQQLMHLMHQWRVSPSDARTEMQGQREAQLAANTWQPPENSFNPPTRTGQDAGMGMEESMRSMELQAGERNAAEPYMVSGYESLAKRDYDLTRENGPPESPKHIFSPLGSAVGANYQQHVDPAYDSRRWWQHSMQTQPMEHQYGAFEHFNNYSEPTSNARSGGEPEDEEMLFTTVASRGGCVCHSLRNIKSKRSHHTPIQEDEKTDFDDENLIRKFEIVLKRHLLPSNHVMEEADFGPVCTQVDNR